MEICQIKLVSHDGKELSGYKVTGENAPKGIVQIAHGMAEEGKRYFNFAEFLVNNGYNVYILDHRGHGNSITNNDELGFIGLEGFENMVRDMHLLTDKIKEQNTNVPVFIFGHSMGSFLLQRYMEIYNHEKISGYILCGSSGKPVKVIDLAIKIAKTQYKFDSSKRSKLLDTMAFGSYNSKIYGRKAKFSWLTRDNEEVEKYMANPKCGFVPPPEFFYSFLNGMKQIHLNNNFKRINKNIPLLIISGKEDPVGRYGKGVWDLNNEFRKIRMKKITMKLYVGGRHEILNEINKEEVYEDVLEFLNGNNLLISKA